MQRKHMHKDYKAVAPVTVNSKKPCVGMFFSEEDEVHTFYTNYAWLKEFGIVGRSSNMGLDGKLNYFSLSC